MPTPSRFRHVVKKKILIHWNGYYQDIITRQYWQRFGPSLAEEGRSSWHSLSALGNSTGWWTILLYLISYAVVLAGAFVVPLYSLIVWSYGYSGSDSCRPDGTFALSSDGTFALSSDFSSDYDLWDVSGIFQITMGFGELTFSNAKLVDAVWDVVVGRGFQAVLALIAYKVTTKSLMMSMEQVSVPIETFEAVTLQDSSFVAFYKQLHSFLAVRGWRHQLRIAWIILSTLFIVAFPTLASAMTGYAPLTDAFLRAQDELLIPFTSYRQIHYIVHDADRIGLDKPLVLTNVPGDSIDVMATTRGDICALDPNIPLQATVAGLVPDWSVDIDERCRMIWHVREYVKEYGFRGMNETQSTFNNSGDVRNLPAPTLNVEAVQHTPFRITTSFYMHYSQLYNALSPEYMWNDAQTGSSAFADSKRAAKYVLAGTNDILTLDEVNQRGSCQQKARYMWGFSFLLLFQVVIFFLVWILGTYALWLDAFLHSRLDIVRRDMGLYRAALDISSVIHSDLDKDVDSLTPNQELRKRIQADKRHGRIGLQCCTDALPSNTRVMSFQAWGRAGGYARWMPRFTLVLFLTLLVTPLALLYSPPGGQSIMLGLILIAAVLTFLNLLILGNGKRRALRRNHSQAEAEAESDSHHPLQSPDDEERTTNGSTISMTTVTTAK